MHDRDTSPDAAVELIPNGAVDSAELNALFAASWPDHDPTDFAPLLRHAAAWVVARRTGSAVGFVKVVWDGGQHAFLLDTTVLPEERRHGLGTRLVASAAAEARRLGAGWLHVDFEPHLAGFYGDCGFRPTDAGLMRLA